MDKRIKIVVEIGNWSFEFTHVKARKTPDGFGTDYDAILDINLEGVKPYVSGLLARDDKEFNKEDYNTVKRFITLCGKPSFDFVRMRNGIKRNKTEG